MVRKVVMLEEMFRDCASQMEIQTVEDLYAHGRKGSAIVYMTKRIKRQWDAMLGKNDKVTPIAKPRTIKINEGGNTHMVVAH